MDVAQDYASLVEYIKRLGSAAVGFSGGVDSTLLLKAAVDALGDRCVALTITAAVNPAREMAEAKALAASMGARHVMIPADVFSIDNFAENSPRRCYFCKKALFTKITDYARREGYAAVLDGANVDDDRDYRPGAEATHELHVVSPLKECGLNKAAIRRISKELGLLTWDKPAYACLASRIPYGETITPEKLAMVEAAEQLLIDQGFLQMRVRHHGDTARIELLPQDMPRMMEPDMRQMIAEAFKKIGFTYTALDLTGYRMGSMNAAL